MTITIHENVIQGSDEWHDLRCGMITASEIKLLLTPTLKIANNDKTRAHAYEILAQRLTKYTEPAYISDDMLRGMDDEILARNLYSEHYNDVTECGFVVNDNVKGLTIGGSPDGFVGNDGIIEIKSRRQKYQAKTIVDGIVPEEYVLQIQALLLITGRKWCDFISYCGGMPMVVIRMEPDEEVQAKIVEAVAVFETKLTELRESYRENIVKMRHIQTERTIEEEITL